MNFWNWFCEIFLLNNFPLEKSNGRNLFLSKIGVAALNSPLFQWEHCCKPSNFGCHLWNWDECLVPLTCQSIKKWFLTHWMLLIWLILFTTIDINTISSLLGFLLDFFFFGLFFEFFVIHARMRYSLKWSDGIVSISLLLVSTEGEWNHMG